LFSPLVLDFSREDSRLRAQFKFIGLFEFSQQEKPKYLSIFVEFCRTLRVYSFVRVPLKLYGRVFCFVHVPLKLYGHVFSFVRVSLKLYGRAFCFCVRSFKTLWLCLLLLCTFL